MFDIFLILFCANSIQRKSYSTRQHSTRGFRLGPYTFQISRVYQICIALVASSIATIEATDTYCFDYEIDFDNGVNGWGNQMPSFPTMAPAPRMPAAPYMPRPGYTTPNPYQQPRAFVHPVFNLDQATKPFKGMNNHTPLNMCITAYYYCENYVMKHAVDNNGNPIEINVSYKTLFREAREHIRNAHPEIPLQVFGRLYQRTRKSERHFADSSCSIINNRHMYNFGGTLNTDWTEDWEPDSCHLDPKYFTNQKLVTGALIIVAGKLAERIPGAGGLISGSLYTFGTAQMYEGYQELPPMPPVYPR